MSTRIQGNEPGPEYSEELKPYRYYVDGELIREFKDEHTALQYFDEDRANCERLAAESGATLSRKVYDDTGYRSVIIISDLCKPGEEYQRPKFVRVDRNKLCTSCKEHGEEAV